MASGPPPGLDNLKRRLERSGRTLTVVASESLIAAANEIVATARFLVPVDTGRLRESIVASPIKKTQKGNLMIEISAGDETTRVGPGNAFQLARIMEFGTRDKTLTARPFLLPAYRLNKRAAKRMIFAGMRKAIKELDIGRR
jgi:HK97 gp10 family phage protein